MNGCYCGCFRSGTGLHRLHRGADYLYPLPARYNAQQRDRPDFKVHYKQAVILYRGTVFPFDMVSVNDSAI